MKLIKGALKNIYHNILIYTEDYYLTELAFMLVITTYLMTSIGGGVIFWVILAIWGHLLVRKHQLGFTDIIIFIVLYAVLFILIGVTFSFLFSHNILFRR